MKNYINFLETLDNRPIYYHGSGNPIIGKFKPTESKRGLLNQETYKNDVYFFTDDIEVAKVFAKDRSNNGIGFITKVYLDIKNTLDLSKDEEFAENFGHKLFPDRNFTDEFPIDLEYIWTWLDIPEIVKKIKLMGYDSVKLAEPVLTWNSTSIAVFDPDKIEIINVYDYPVQHE